MYAEGAELHSPFAGSVVGPEGAMKMARAFVHAFPDAKITASPPVVDGHRAVLSAMISGTDRGGMMGLEPSQRPFHFPIVFLLEVRDGHIVRDRRVYDFTGFLVQVGVLKAKPA
jgi:predicted ester cyclase